MSTVIRWTSADLKNLPQDGKRYEIINGELHVSTQPHYHHQLTCANLTTVISNWNRQAGVGEVIYSPGLIFADDDDVAPDLVWVSRDRLRDILRDDGHLHAAPELVVEVLSPGSANQKRDCETKLWLYSRRGVDEYWIADWQRQQIEIYRREDGDLDLAATLCESDTLTSPLLPGFGCQVANSFQSVAGIE